MGPNLGLKPHGVRPIEVVREVVSGRKRPLDVLENLSRALRSRAHGQYIQGRLERAIRIFLRVLRVVLGSSTGNVSDSITIVVQMRVAERKQHIRSLAPSYNYARCRSDDSAHAKRAVRRC